MAWRQITRRLLIGLLMVGLFGWLSAGQVRAQGQLADRSLTLSDPNAGEQSQYVLGFRLDQTTTLGSLSIEICASSPLPEEVCTAPTGFTIAAATLSAQTGQTGFQIASGATSNELVLSRTAAAVGSNKAVTFTFSNVTNPATPTDYFVRVATYASTDASGAQADYGAAAFAIDNAVDVSATVPPYLLFCVAVKITSNDCSQAAGSFIDLGDLSSAKTATATNQFVVATNGGSGYNIRLTGSTLTSGNDVIPALAGPTGSQIGTSQFGMNLRANSSPSVGTDMTGGSNGAPMTNYNQANKYTFNSGDVIASAPRPDYSSKYTASYIINASNTQASGVYVTTLTYTCLANF